MIFYSSQGIDSTVSGPLGDSLSFLPTRIAYALSHCVIWYSADSCDIAFCRQPCVTQQESSLKRGDFLLCKMKDVGVAHGVSNTILGTELFLQTKIRGLPFPVQSKRSENLYGTNHLEMRSKCDTHPLTCVPSSQKSTRSPGVGRWGQCRLGGWMRTEAVSHLSLGCTACGKTGWCMCGD